MHVSPGLTLKYSGPDGLYTGKVITYYFRLDLEIFAGPDDLYTRVGLHVSPGLTLKYSGQDGLYTGKGITF